MSTDLVVNSTKERVSIAVLEDAKLVELHESTLQQKFSVGDIYLAKIKKIMPGLNAAFINVGYEKDAFLHYLDLGPQFSSLSRFLNHALDKRSKYIPVHKFNRLPDINKNGKITEVLKTGQNILVQIAKEPISTKGPRLTSEVSIAGRNLVLIPFSDKISVSSKIASQEERDRLKNLMTSIRPKNFGIIVRTVAEGKKVALLDTELRSLIKKWEKSVENLTVQKVPTLVFEEISRISAVVRDHLNVQFENIYTDDPAVYHEIKEYIGEIAPEKEKIVKLYEGREPIFDKLGIIKQIKKSFGKTVSFKHGAYLIIEHTEALHVIDVNSGNRSKSAGDQETTALEVNLAAVEEIARQLRLRDMGGIIVVDFIDMQKNDHKQKVYEKMKEVMAKDKTKHNILPLSKFGLMQITRQRVRPEMHIDTSENCPTCRGSGKVQPPILFPELVKAEISTIIEQHNLKKLNIHLHPFVAHYLKRGLNSTEKKWRRELSCKIRIVPDDSNHFLEYAAFNANGEELHRKSQ
ncbi:MAG: Rne/Rng family ribonuclease [Bacteroidales bacterium]|nr:Rne/Rng family ribonuclease [Bacteroidales bacterium]MBN2698183.1 Rne/Rng family ribonuclease [Bacteroidales bacterium]